MRRAHILDNWEIRRSRMRRVTVDMFDLDGRRVLHPQPYEEDVLKPWYLNAVPVRRKMAKALVTDLAVKKQSIHSPQCQTMWVLIEWCRINRLDFEIKGIGLGAKDGYLFVLGDRKWSGATTRKYAPSYVHALTRGMTDEDKEIFNMWHQDLRVSYIESDIQDEHLMREMHVNTIMLRQFTVFGKAVRGLLEDHFGKEDVILMPEGDYLQVTSEYGAELRPIKFKHYGKSLSYVGFMPIVEVYSAGTRDEPPSSDSCDVPPAEAGLWALATRLVKMDLDIGMSNKLEYLIEKHMPELEAIY